MRHDHAVTVMRLVSLDHKPISPIYADKRAQAPLLIVGEANAGERVKRELILVKR